MRRITEQLRGLRGPLLPVLHEVVATHGYVDDDDVAVVAEVLNLSRADVHGVVTFYSDFRRTSPPAHRVAPSDAVGDRLGRQAEPPCNRRERQALGQEHLDLIAAG